VELCPPSTSQGQEGLPLPNPRLQASQPPPHAKTVRKAHRQAGIKRVGVGLQQLDAQASAIALPLLPCVLKRALAR
jgi:hypothetical protein